MLLKKYNIDQKMHIYCLEFSYFFPFQSNFSMESLTKPELLMLFSILEGELEARDLVIDALKVLKVSSIIIFFMRMCVWQCMILLSDTLLKKNQIFLDRKLCH